MAFPRCGFVASRHLTGQKPVLKQFEVEAGANNAFFIGDPVVLTAAGKIIPVTAAASANFSGVIAAVYGKINDYDPPRPLTFSHPTNGPYLTTGQSGFALVNVDPNQLYIAQLDVTASIGLIGATIGISAGTPNTAVGRSGYNLKGSTVGTDAERPFKIVGLAPSELITGRGDKPAGCGIEVKPNLSSLTNTTGV